MNEIDYLKEMNRKLDVLLKLLAYQTVGKLTLTEGAPLLRRLNFTPSEIAAIYESTVGSVQVRLADYKKKKTQKK